MNALPLDVQLSRFKILNYQQQSIQVEVEVHRRSPKQAKRL